MFAGIGSIQALVPPQMMLIEAVGAIASFLDKARELIPYDAPKSHQSRFFYLRGALRADLRDTPGAIQDFNTAMSVWPSPSNTANKALEDLYRTAGDTEALQGLQERVDRLKRPTGR